MDSAITLGSILVICATLVALSGGVAVIVSLVKNINTSHDRAQKWDGYDSEIAQIKAEQCMLTYCMLATLNGLEQLGANGPVTEAKDKLTKHLNQQAHGVLK